MVDIPFYLLDGLEKLGYTFEQREETTFVYDRQERMCAVFTREIAKSSVFSVDTTSFSIYEKQALEKFMKDFLLLQGYTMETSTYSKRFRDMQTELKEFEKSFK